jgi:hypothetical protein
MHIPRQVFVISMLCLIPASALAGGSPQWRPAHVIKAVSVTDGGRVFTAAVIDLQMCYEGRMQAWTRMPFSYEAVIARVPGTEHKLCGLAIRQVVISISEPGDRKTVGLHTADGNQTLPVSRAGVVVTF